MLELNEVQYANLREAEDDEDRGATDFDFGSSMLSPLILKVQRHVRAYRKL